MKPLWKAAWNFLRKLKIELPYDPAIPLLGIYLKETKTLTHKDTGTPVLAALFTAARTWERPRSPSLHAWVKKRWCVSGGILLGHEKGPELAIATASTDLKLLCWRK